MTIRRQWLMVLFLVAILSVATNTAVLGSLTNKSFKSHINNTYKDQVSKIIEYSNEVLKDHNSVLNYTTLEVNSYLVDPIKGIEIYDHHDNLIVNVSSKQNFNMGRNESSNGMGKKSHGMDSKFEEIESIDIMQEGERIGRLVISKNSSVDNSIASKLFMANLLSNSAKSIAIVLVIAFLIGAIVSKKMSRELVMTANKAQDIELGNKSKDIKSKVKEIQVIEYSLDSLKMKLELKQRSRKKLIDQLIHQTRTPLTILKTHIEGYEDGVIELNDDETKILIHEVDNVTSIISNLSGMIDAEKDYESIDITSFDVCEVVNQIISALRLQFEKKSIKLETNCESEIIARSDRYKLSQVVYNVITNAYKYSNKGDEVTIDVSKDKSRFIIQISDNGIGISEDEREKIFDAYYRSKKNNELSGDGIGLYVARENMNQIAGEIRLDDNYSNGSKFIIEFSDYND